MIILSSDEKLKGNFAYEPTVFKGSLVAVWATNRGLKILEKSTSASSLTVNSGSMSVSGAINEIDKVLTDCFKLTLEANKVLHIGKRWWR